MSATSKIEWTDATWNPVTGCTKVSPGCDRCYAETFAERWRGTPGHHFENGFDVTLRSKALELPLRWRKPRRVFVNSMSDLFHKDVPDEFIAQTFAVMALTPQHTYQVLTKRHARMRHLLNADTFHTAVLAWTARLQDETHPMPAWNPGERSLKAWPIPNVWLGVSVEDQQRVDLRIPALLETPAAVRFLSCEPLLGPVWIADHVWQPCPCCLGEGHDLACGDCDIINRCEGGHVRALHWVIAGGESGHGARPMHPEWARELRDQCEQENVPFFFKQWGEYRPGGDPARPADWITESGEVEPWTGPGSTQTAMVRVGKKAAGRTLNGRTHDDFPEVS